MALTETQQTYEALKKSCHPLVTFRHEHDGDCISASLALAMLLKKLGSQPEIACHDFELPENYSFLPEATNIKNKLSNLRKFIISLDIAETPIENVSHIIEKNKLHIHIEPKSGIIEQNSISTANTAYRHDLIITISSPDLDSLHNIYEQHTDFFYQTPIMNIDHSPENENFGHYNLVDVTATSVSEIIFDLIEKIDSSLLDEQIATCLLTGMILKTKSFKIPKLTPKSLNIAGQLIATGANRDEIIKNLYQTKSVNTLKLWGRVLQSLETDENKKIAWAHITQNDLAQTSTSIKDIHEVINELIVNIPTIELTSIFYETPEGLSCLIKTENKINLLDSLQDYNPKGNKHAVKFKLDKSTPEDIVFHLQSLVK